MDFTRGKVERPLGLVLRQHQDLIIDSQGIRAGDLIEIVQSDPCLGLIVCMGRSWEQTRLGFRLVFRFRLGLGRIN